ncbi:hypothetical protein AB1M95_09670 [Sulfitobacter sp. LCG007]
MAILPASPTRRERGPVHGEALRRRHSRQRDRPDEDGRARHGEFRLSRYRGGTLCWPQVVENNPQVTMMRTAPEENARILFPAAINDPAFARAVPDALHSIIPGPGRTVHAAH